MAVLGAQTTTDWRPLMDESSARMLTSLIDPVGPWRSWERASMASRRSWVRIPSAPPKTLGPTRTHRYVPATWVTTLGPTDFEWFENPSFQLEVSQIIIDKAGQPDVVVNFFDADGLTGEDR